MDQYCNVLYVGLTLKITWNLTGQECSSQGSNGHALVCPFNTCKSVFVTSILLGATEDSISDLQNVNRAQSLVM